MSTVTLADPGIPTLENAFDPVALREYLPEVLPSEWGAIRDVRLEVLKHHPGLRCTFEVTLRTTRGRYALIGKVHAVDRSDVYDAMERIWRAGFGQHPEFSIPRPHGYVPALQLLLLEKVEGRRAKTVILEGSHRERAIAAERCARWLARFQALVPRVGRVLDRNEHLAALKRWSHDIAKVDAPLGGRAARLFERLEATASRLSGVERCAGHGSYSCAQIILADDPSVNGWTGRTIPFDWDGYDVADPCRDVARFAVHLRRLARGRLGSIRALDPLGEAFLRAYVAERGPECLANLAFYQAATCLQFGGYLARRQSRDVEKTAAMLDEGLRILERRTP